MKHSAAAVSGGILALISIQALSTASTVSAAVVCQTQPQMEPTDFVFLMDASPSMCAYSASIANGLNNFVQLLENNNVDARFAIVSFGGSPQLIQPFSVRIAMFEIFEVIFLTVFLLLRPMVH